MAGVRSTAHWTSGHHLEHWIRGGSTELKTWFCCAIGHHWMVHEGKWQIAGTDDGQFLTVPPQMDLFRQPARGPDTNAA